tara:strand:+ start:666 stop:1031 length:366 start_codon:yes stop_codon:yes gene_type:complete
MNEESASWNTKYITDGYGKSLKISDMSMNQVSNHIKNCNIKTKVILKQLEGLYQRRFNLHEDSNYKLRNAKTKMGKWIGIKKDKKAERMQQILITALDFLQKGKSLELVEAILIQAKEEFN